MTALHTLLHNKNISFEMIAHPQPIRSAQDGADYFGIEIGQTAPTLVLETDRGYISAILSGDRGRLDFQKIAAILGCREGAGLFGVPLDIRKGAICFGFEATKDVRFMGGFPRIIEIRFDLVRRANRPFGLLS